VSGIGLAVLEHLAGAIPEGLGDATGHDDPAERLVPGR
jgi:hypothetical protein